MQYPLYQEISYIDPVYLFQQIYGIYPYNSLFLDSSNYDKGSISAFNQYSYIAFDPVDIISYENGMTYLGDAPQQVSPFDFLNQYMETLPQYEKVEGLPAFQGGLAGFFGYELLHTLEEVPFPKEYRDHQSQIEDMRVGYYDLVLAFDHEQKKGWAFSCHPVNAAARLKWVLSFIDPFLQRFKDTPQTEYRHPICPPLQEMVCDFSQQEFEETLHQTLEYIVSGDIFQANITRRMKGILATPVCLMSLYERLRSINPAPFSAFLKWRYRDRSTSLHTPQTQFLGHECAILSSSPERFISISCNGDVETKPIKGTRKRYIDDFEKDQQEIEQLKNSEKDRAENMMIVDLMRNDLSKVCRPFSVKTPALCYIESYQTVHHLVSTIVGSLKNGKTPIDVLKATFPGGSITGAPKVRAMEIISELEKVPRGPYCGSMGYVSLNGSMDTSIMIRTLVVKDREICFNVGGGIVADSDPCDEYVETCTKAKALMHTLLKES